LSLKTRLAKLEAAQALKAKPVEELYDPDGSKLAAVIKSINDGTYRLTHPRESWVIRPAPDETDILGTHLHNTCNRIAEKEQREAMEREQGKQVRI
jgi:hypothetical protein